MKDDFIDEFNKKTIFVIGDLMLDKYLYGETSRISPEAPVPVVRVVSDKNILGGAGNAANNLAALKCKVIVAGVTGKDKDSDIIKKLLKNQGIKSYVIKDNTRSTTVKNRIISGNNFQVIRLDYEETSKISSKIEEELFQKIKEHINEIDAILISDYAKGVLTEKLAKKIIEIAKNNNKIITVDAKPDQVLFLKNCTLITPNLKEATEMSGIKKDVTKMGTKLVNMLKSNVFITRGSEGISVFDKSGNHTQIPPTKLTKIVDVTGAGDTVIAVATIGLVLGLNLINSARLANYAAGLVVQKPGTATVDINELLDTIRDSNKEVFNFN